MDILSIMEKQLLVLQKIEDRLAKVESKLNDQKSSSQPESKEINNDTAIETDVRITSGAGASTPPDTRPRLSRSHSLESLTPSDRQSAYFTESNKISTIMATRSEDERIEAAWGYLHAKAIDLGEKLDRLGIPIQNQGNPAQREELWTRYLGNAWRLPPDDRVHLAFQQHIIERVAPGIVEGRLEEQLEWSARMGLGNFVVRDFDYRGNRLDYELPTEIQGSPSDVPSLENHVTSGGAGTYQFNVRYDESVVAQSGVWKQRRLMNAPWRRLITVKGLTSCGATQLNTEPRLQTFGHPSIHALPNAPIFPVGSSNYLFRQFLDRHINLHHPNPEAVASVWETDNNFPSMAFQIIAYMILPESTKKMRVNPDYPSNETWPTGHLYDKTTKIVQVAYSTYAACAFEKITQEGMIQSVIYKPVPQYWTIVDLQPRYAPRRLEVPGVDLDAKVPGWDKFEPSNAPQSFLTLVYHSILKAAVSWRELVTYFDKFLDEGKIFMDPPAHDNLLVDDEAFARSRKYFWALSCLSEFQTCIDDNIHQWDVSRFLWEKSLRLDGDWSGVERKIEQIDMWVDKMRSYSKRFKEHHERVSALRDGLFNASSVMESRDANKLGENVKLLTFVSIFFLPLAFCTSLWSMNTDLFSLTSFVYVIVLVALATYFVVFNLNSIVRLGRLAYGTQRSRLLHEMKNESSSFWQRKGGQFESFSFKPQTKLSKPSEWLVGLYFAKTLLASLLNTLKRPWQSRKKVASEEVDG